MLCYVSFFAELCPWLHCHLPESLLDYPVHVLCLPFLSLSSRRHLGCQLVEMEKMIEKMMEVDLVQIAVNDVQARLRMYRKISKEGSRSSSSSVEEIDTEVIKKKQSEGGEGSASERRMGGGGQAVSR